MGDDLGFLKYLDTSQLISNDFLVIYNNDIIKIDLSSWNKINLIEMAFSFENCSSLKYVDLSGDVKIVEETDFTGLFYNSDSIKAINIKGWDFSSIVSSSFMDLNTSFIFSVLQDTSSIKIFIDDKMIYYLDTIKEFFDIDNSDQFTTASWPY